MRWILLVLVVVSVQYVRAEDGEPPQDDEWQEMPQGQEGTPEQQEEWHEMPREQEAQEEPEYHELHEVEDQETTTRFVNPWTQAPDYSGDRVFEDDDDNVDEMLRPEWEAQEFQTTKAPWTRRTFNWTQRTRNWTTPPRTTRKMFTGLTYNSSHVLCTKEPYHLIEPTEFTSYIVVDNHNRYDPFIKYREAQIETYRRRIKEIKAEMKSLDTVEKCLSKGGFDRTSENNITSGLNVDLREHKLNQELNLYESTIDNFEKQIEASKNLNQLDEKKDKIRKELAKKEEIYAMKKADDARKNTNGTNGNREIVDIPSEYSEEYYRINDTYCDILYERAPLVQSLQNFNKEYNEMLNKLEQIKYKVYNKNDYEHILLNLRHLIDKLELELTNDKIDIETYEERKKTIGEMQHVIRVKTLAAEHLDGVREAQYKSNYWKRTLKTNVTLDHYMYDGHLNKTLASMGKQLRDLFQVKSLEYDDGTDYSEINHGNKTDGHFIVLQPNDTDILLNNSRYNEKQYVLQNNKHFTERESNQTNQKIEENVKNNTSKEAFNEDKHHTWHSTELYPVTESRENSNEFNSSEEVGRKFKHQHYNEVLGEKYINQLKDLEQQIDAVHAKVNKTYEKFSNLWDRLGFSIYMAEIADKYNYQNLVRIFGIPANFSKYQTQEGKNLTEELVLQRIGTQLNKKLSLKKIRQVYQDWSSDYLRPPLVAEFYSHKEKLKWIKDYMNFILIKPRKPDQKPIFTRLKLKPRVVYMPWIEYRNYPLKYKYDRFIVRDDLPPRMNQLILRVKRKINETGMSNSSFVWHNNSRVFFRRHYHGRIRPVSYFDNLDKLFEESDERSREETVDEMPQYLQKRTTSFGKRWVMMKAKRKFFMRPTKKKTTKYMFWAVTKQKSTRIMDTTIDRKVLAKQYRVW